MCLGSKRGDEKDASSFSSDCNMLATAVPGTCTVVWTDRPTALLLLSTCISNPSPRVSNLTKKRNLTPEG